MPAQKERNAKDKKKHKWLGELGMSFEMQRTVCAARGEVIRKMLFFFFFFGCVCERAKKPETGAARKSGESYTMVNGPTGEELTATPRAKSSM